MTVPSQEIENFKANYPQCTSQLLSGWVQRSLAGKEILISENNLENISNKNLLKKCKNLLMEVIDCQMYWTLKGWYFLLLLEKL